MTHEPVQINGAGAVAEEGGENKRKRSLKQRAVHEVKQLAAMFVYLYVLFALFLIHESIVLAQHAISFSHYGFAFINALVLAKVMLVAEDLHLGSRFEDRPLVYPILFKSLVFAIVFICFHIVENVVVGVWGGKTIAESVPSIGGGGLKGVLSVGAIVSFGLIPYFAFKEVGRVIGENELRALILTRRPKAGALRSRVRPRESA